MSKPELALITGASSGIGRELARIAAGAGMNLVLSGRRKQNLEELAAELTRLHSVNVLVIGSDLGKEGEAERLYKEASACAGVPDLVVNNAGFGLYGPFTENDLQEEIAMLRLNIEALMIISKLAAKDMVTRGTGRILNVASAAGFVPGPFMAVYYASKAFVLSFSEALAMELADRGVSVSVLCPGPVKTEFQKRAGVEKLKIFRRAASAEEVARLGFVQTMKGKRLIIPGGGVKMALSLQRMVPRCLSLKVVHSLQKKRKEQP